MGVGLRVHPLVFGILNVTADSFSDGGKYLAPEAAIAHGRALSTLGADVVDVGPASSHPDGAPVSADEEIRRLRPVVAAFAEEGIAFSVDSFLPETQAFALKAGAAYLNDIQGFRDADFYPTLAAASAKLVVMHSIQAHGPATRAGAPSGPIFDHVCRFFDGRLEAMTGAGIARDRLILDPGLGFFLGDRPEPSFEMLARLGDLKARYGLPVLVSLSRKSFLRAVTGREVQDIGAATLAGELFAVRHGADYIRTHDPGALRDGLVVWNRLGEPP